ncbi:hypothetical protein FOE78_16790 [Microlunatus elymi]|uniref:Uncharacterized protein n=1 Tax=Microlunatus elymi TaxID=2596828 RepID=A0A516Q1Q1_9ACTN|nr:hypothetical protein [Microlunatus elymi]QDP97356.1 hypothetical protein FOE78_16790 [Microlunatus elymi]
MGLFSKLRRRGDDDGGADQPLALDVDARRTQLQDLEQALDGLVRLMRERTDLMENPGWRAKITEYDMVAGEAMQLRRGTPTREAVLDLGFEVRPAVTAKNTNGGLDEIVAQQQVALAAAQALIDVLPSER